MSSGFSGSCLCGATCSFYTRHGDWFVAACAAWLAAAGALAFSGRRETPALHGSSDAGPLEAASR